MVVLTTAIRFEKFVQTVSRGQEHYILKAQLELLHAINCLTCFIFDGIFGPKEKNISLNKKEESIFYLAVSSTNGKFHLNSVAVLLAALNLTSIKMDLPKKDSTESMPMLVCDH